VAERVDGRRRQLATLLVSRSEAGDPVTTQERRVIDDHRARDDRRTSADQQENAS